MTDKPVRNEIAKTLQYYDQHGDEYFRNTVGLDLSELHAAFLRELPRTARILDAGCGSGRDAKAFLAQGYQVTAIDGSKRMAELASDLLGIRVAQKRFAELGYVQEFDGVWANASLLHLPLDQMRDAFGRLLTALIPGGVLFASLKSEVRAAASPSDTRHFTIVHESDLRLLLKAGPANQIVRIWRNEDVRGAKYGVWLNVLTRRLT